MATRKIKFIHHYRGWKNANPFGGSEQNAGDVVECDEKRAKWFVEESKVQWAEYVIEDKKEKKVETASVVPEGERAVKEPKPEKRKVGRPPKVKEPDDVNVL